MNGREILKQMAKQAKDRLQGKTNKHFTKNNILCVKTNQSYIKTVIINNDADVEMYNKVKNTVDNDSINPLNEIIDFNYYKSLSNEQKERYFFMIADKYRQLKKRYEIEKMKEVY